MTEKVDRRLITLLTKVILKRSRVDGDSLLT